MAAEGAINRSGARRSEDDRASTVRRIGNLVGALDLDCACRERLTEALARFAELEETRARREPLLAARHELELIEGLLSLLAELHDIGAAEPDTTVYAELERLFLDLADAATRGAAAMRAAREG